MPNHASPRDLAVGVPASLVAGLPVGTLGTFKHQFGVSAATGDGFPIGLLLSIGMVAAFLVALRIAFPSRWYAAAAGLGVVVAEASLSTGGPGGGSTVILGNAVGAVWIVAPAVLGVVIVAWPRRRSRAGGDVDGILEVDRADPGRPRVDGVRTPK